MLDRLPTTEECLTPTPMPKRRAFVAVGRDRATGAEVRVSCVERSGAQYLLDHWNHNKILPLRIEREPCTSKHDCDFPMCMCGLEETPMPVNIPTEEQHNATVQARMQALSETSSTYGREVRELTTLESYVSTYGGSIGDPSITWTHASGQSGAREVMTLATAELRKDGVFKEILDRAVCSKARKVRILRTQLEKLLRDTE